MTIAFSSLVTEWFEDRFGTVRRQFTVEIDGKRDGDAFVLDERFVYSDGERDQRVWRIRKTGPHSYEGRAADIAGTAKGVSFGNALNWHYEMDLKIGDGTWRVRFDDWMFLQPSGVLINRARVSKFGFELGTVTLAFVKPDRVANVSVDSLNDWRSAAGSRAAANQ